MLPLIWLAAAMATQASPSTTTTVEIHKSVQGGEIDKADADKIISTCGARKFESSAIIQDGGKTRRAKVMLCAKPGESDADWIATLQKAEASLDASDRMPEEAKEKIGAELRAEIARLTAPLPQR